MLERFRTQLDPSSAEAERAARGLAQELLNGPAARAERAVRALLRQQQQSRSREPEAWLFWAAFAAKTGSRSAALQSLARLDSLRPSPGQWCEAASLYAGLGDERRARDILARAWPAASVQSSPDRLMQAALLSQRLGRDREALELFGRLVAAHPGSARYLSNRGVARARLGMKEQALADLRGAIALDPRLLQSSLSLGVLLSAMGRPEEARAVYDEALRVRDPADANVLPLLREARGRLPGGRD